MTLPAANVATTSSFSSRFERARRIDQQTTRRQHLPRLRQQGGLARLQLRQIVRL